MLFRSKDDVPLAAVDELEVEEFAVGIELGDESVVIGFIKLR